MEKLLKTAAALGTGAVLAWSSRAEAQRPTMPCDPVPPPVGCCQDPDGFREPRCLLLAASWSAVPTDPSSRTFDMNLSIELNPSIDQFTFDRLARADIKLTGATLRELTLAARRARLALSHTGNGTQVEAVVPVSCGGKTVSLTLLLDVSGQPADRALIPVKQAEWPIRPIVR